MRTKVIDNKGSGIDISDSALVTMNHCQVQDNVGGVWLWQQARIKVQLHTDLILVISPLIMSSESIPLNFN